MANIIEWIKSVNAMNVERAYKHMDAALSSVRSYSESPDAVDKAGVDEDVSEARADAARILAYEGRKTWDGMFREVHEYLAKLHMELEEYDEAEEQGRFVLEYDRQEGDHLLKQIAAHKRGERLGDFDPSAVDESEE